MQQQLTILQQKAIILKGQIGETFKGIIAPRLLIKQKWTTIMIMIKVAMKSHLRSQQCYCILNTEGPASMNTIKPSKRWQDLRTRS
jgi:hypothetical protein